jgi:hypothetical protein
MHGEQGDACAFRWIEPKGERTLERLRIRWWIILKWALNVRTET